MNRVMIAASAAALFAGSSLAALAAEVTGAIETIDTTALTVTLDDGNTYVLPPAFDVSNLQIGMRVKIEYEMEADGDLAASAVEPAA